MIVNFNNLTNILYNTTAVNKVMFNNVEVWSSTPYRRVFAVQSDRTQLIDLGFKSNIDTDDKTLTFSWAQTAGANEMACGSSTNYSDKSDCVYRYVSASWTDNVVYYTTSSYSTNNISTPTNISEDDLNYHTYNWNNKNFSVDGVSIRDVDGWDFGEQSRNMALFGVTSSSSLRSAINFVEFIVYRNGLKFKHFIPVVLTQEVDGYAIGTVGIWDLVGNVFLTSNIGNPLKVIEKEYADWVYDLGEPIYALKKDNSVLGSQYFNTGVAYNNNEHAFETTFYFLDNNTTTSVCGSRKDVGVSSLGATNIFRNVTSLNTLRADCNGNTTVIYDMPPNTLRTIRSDERGFSVNGSLDVSRSGSSVENNQPFYIGTMNAGGQVTIVGANQLIFTYTFYDIATGNILQKVIPFKAKDGTLGMLDIVSRELLTNAGSGEFTEVSLDTTTAQLISLGVTPSSSVEENIVMLNNMGVSV